MPPALRRGGPTRSRITAPTRVEGAALSAFFKRFSALWVKTKNVQNKAPLQNQNARPPLPQKNRPSHRAAIDPKKPLELGCCLVGVVCRWWKFSSFFLLVDLLVFFLGGFCLLSGPLFEALTPLQNKKEHLQKGNKLKRQSPPSFFAGGSTSPSAWAVLRFLVPGVYW